MSAEMWQFAGVAGVGAGIVILWVLFVYRPRRTGEGTPPVNLPDDKKGQE